MMNWLGSVDEGWGRSVVLRQLAEALGAEAVGAVTRLDQALEMAQTELSSGPIVPGSLEEEALRLVVRMRWLVARLAPQMAALTLDLRILAGSANQAEEPAGVKMPPEMPDGYTWD